MLKFCQDWYSNKKNEPLWNKVYLNTSLKVIKMSDIKAAKLNVWLELWGGQRWQVATKKITYRFNKPYQVVSFSLVITNKKDIAGFLNQLLHVYYPQIKHVALQKERNESLRERWKRKKKQPIPLPDAFAIPKYKESIQFVFRPTENEKEVFRMDKANFNVQVTLFPRNAELRYLLTQLLVNETKMTTRKLQHAYNVIFYARSAFNLSNKGNVDRAGKILKKLRKWGYNSTFPKEKLQLLYP